MAQPPAWLRHQAVDPSARAMVSMTWKKVRGSVSIPFDERGSSKRNSPASCSLSSSAGGSRRVLSLSPEAPATAARTASARETTLRSPARSAEVEINLSKTVLAQPMSPDRSSEACGELLVDLFDRLAPGLDPEEIIHRSGHQKPAAEIDEGHRNLRQRHVGLEIIAGAHDQGEPYRSDDLADAAETIGRTHARRPEVGGPDFRRIGSDDGEAAVGEKIRDGQYQPERRHAHDR